MRLHTSCEYTSAFIATDAAMDASCDQGRLQADENFVSLPVRERGYECAREREEASL